MYSEFIITYVGLGIIVALLITILVLLIVLLHKQSNDLPGNMFVNQRVSANNVQTGNVPQPNTSAADSSVVFCKNCYTQFDAKAQFCPKCGTPRG